MSVFDENVEAIVGYFKSGIKEPGQPGRLGVEIEHIVVGPHSQAVSYSEEYGVKWILEQLAADFDERAYGDDKSLLGLAGGNQTITLEPAAQLELSAGPYEYASDMRDDYLAFQRRFDQLVGDKDRRAVAIGYHPTAAADDLELIPKQRYRFMDAHFAKIGPFGRCMMRGSASTQVSIDYYSTEDCLRKLRLASALSPFLALLCDNSPMFEGKPRTHHMVRTEIWQKCDPARCGTIPGVLDPSFTLEDYARYILNTPAIFDYKMGMPFATEKTFGELHDEAPMSTEDIEHALSMFFNDVRLKTYIEIRPADSMPIPFATAYATLIKGLFYCNDSLDGLEGIVGGVSEADVLEAKEALMADGYDAVAYGRQAAEIIDSVIDLARHALPPVEGSMLLPLRQLAAARKTLAMMGAHH